MNKGYYFNKEKSKNYIDGNLPKLYKSFKDFIKSIKEKGKIIIASVSIPLVLFTVGCNNNQNTYNENNQYSQEQTLEQSPEQPLKITPEQERIRKERLEQVQREKILYKNFCENGKIIVIDFETNQVIKELYVKDLYINYDSNNIIVSQTPSEKSMPLMDANSFKGYVLPVIRSTNDPLESVNITPEHLNYLIELEINENTLEKEGIVKK